MPTPNPLFLREEELDRGLELLFMADLRRLADAADLLDRGGLDETDHRTLFVVERRPGMTLAELSAVLGQRKQTLSRHVRELVAAGLLEQGAGSADRRTRPLRLTSKASAVLGAIHAAQKRRLRMAFKNAGAAAVEGFERVLAELLSETPTLPQRTPGR